jgi:hypothetical protein
VETVLIPKIQTKTITASEEVIAAHQSFLEQNPDQDFTLDHAWHQTITLIHIDDHPRPVEDIVATATAEALLHQIVFTE